MQKNIKEDLHNKWLKKAELLTSQRPNSLLLQAPNNCSIEALTLKIASKYLCLNKENSYSCSCQSCAWVNDNSHPDLVTVFSKTFDSKSANVSEILKIQEIQKLTSFFQLSSHQGNYRVAIIGALENLTYTASNALLKILEEPSSNMKFILFAHSLLNVPLTITSRCQKINLNLTAEELSKIQFFGCDIIPWLVPILKKGKNINPIECAKVAEKYSSYSLITRILSWMHDVSRVKFKLNPISYTNELDYLIKVSSSIVQQYKWIETYFEILEMKRIAKHPINTKLFLETLFIKLKNGFN